MHKKRRQGLAKFLLFFYLCSCKVPAFLLPLLLLNQTKEEPTMQITLSSDALWSMLQSLSPDTKRWLGEKLIEASEEEQRLTPYTMEEING